MLFIRYQSRLISFDMTEQPGKATESARKTVETPSKLEMTFDRIKKQLPPSAVTAIDKAETQLRSLAVSGRDQFDDLTHSKSIKSLQTKLSTEQWFSCAYSVTNSTAIALSISLNVCTISLVIEKCNRSEFRF